MVLKLAMVLRQEFNEKGKCNSCGFLSKRLFLEPATPECTEASLYDRSFGTLYNKTTVPWCFRGIVNLREEVEDLASETEKQYNVCVVEIINTDRQCPQWYLWKEFLSPKEHFEDYRIRQLEELNRQARKQTNMVTIFLGLLTLIFTIVQIFCTINN